MNDLVYWIWLSLSCTIDTGTFSKLISKFNGAKEIYEADEREIAECIGYKTSDRANLASKSLERAEEIYDFCVSHRVGMLRYSDKEYPEALRNTQTPPVLLYYRGKLPDFNSGLYVAMVGTRELSEYGRKNAFNIGYDLAIAGATVVSGMALGIDGVALAGALAAEKPTVAVLGSGIDVCYPSQHLTLAREIVKRGCILTEYPPKTKPNKYNFPKRNRIISGLCSATLVIEGRERSGALITARYAENQGRALYALPGNVGSDHSELTNLLLKKGAKPATRAEDILDAFEEKYKGKINQFLLRDRRNVDMMYVLRTLEVVANCPSDDIYNQPWIIKRSLTPNAPEYESPYAPATDAPDAFGVARSSGCAHTAADTHVSANGKPSESPSERSSSAEKEPISEGTASKFERMSTQNGMSQQTTVRSEHRTALSRQPWENTREGASSNQADAISKSNRLSESKDTSSRPSASRMQAKSPYDRTFTTSQRLPREDDLSMVFRASMPAFRSGGGLQTVPNREMHLEPGRAGTDDITNFDFDEQTLKIYKKIPPGGAIEIEDLTTENMPMRTVMKYLTQLESCKFIVILPGGKVMRKY